jgi:aryl-alcohol dehydrogenase-like predicted oxidoreductase
MEQEIIPMCINHNIKIIPWGALGQGKLTGQHLKTTKKNQKIQKEKRLQ